MANNQRKCSLESLLSRKRHVKTAGRQIYICKLSLLWVSQGSSSILTGWASSTVFHEALEPGKSKTRSPIESVEFCVQSWFMKFYFLLCLHIAQRAFFSLSPYETFSPSLLCRLYPPDSINSSYPPTSEGVNTCAIHTNWQNIHINLKMKCSASFASQQSKGICPFGWESTT